MKKTIGAGLLAFVLTGCGGGGGGSSTTSSPPVTSVTPVPTVSLTIDQAKVALGHSVKLTWSSTNATSCTASGAWSGAQAISGSSSLTPTLAGASTYTLTCTGAGGTASQSAALTVPLPVEKSSYENKTVAVSALGPQTLPILTNGEVISAGYAFADFFQDGTYSMVAFTNNVSHADAAHVNDLPGKAHFFQKINGAWVDKTSTLLNDQAGCIAPRKVIVADFNGDGMPDVFASCHGYDGPPFPGEKSHLLLSQADGSYKNVTMPFDCFCHGASAADVNGNGFANILVADQMVKQTPYFLINNKDGTFTQDMTRLPASLKSHQIWTAELIDFNHVGHYDVFLAGAEPGSTATTEFAAQQFSPSIFLNDGTDHFSDSNVRVLPADPSNGMTLDIIADRGYVYLLRTNIFDANNSYSAASIQKIEFAALSSTNIYKHVGNYPGLIMDQSWVPWFGKYQGRIVSLNAAYDVAVNP
jgi:hypothetical protein